MSPDPQPLFDRVRAMVASSQDEQNRVMTGVEPCQIKFTWSHGGEEVFLAGSFNQFQPIQMVAEPNESGSFSIVLQLPPGTYEYRFIVDGQV